MNNDKYDDSIHITKSKNNDSGKTIIKEVSDEPGSAPQKHMNAYLTIPGTEQNVQPFRHITPSTPSPSPVKKPKKYEFIEVTDANGKTVKMRRPIEEKKEEDIDTADTVPNLVLDVHENNLTAYIMVHRKIEGRYTKEELIHFLHENGIVYGIIEENIDKIVAGKCYYEETIIARGTPPSDGIDGYFEYHFNPAPETKPIILADGSVDYNTLGKMELVIKDQLLVTYHPSRACVDGKDIFGNLLPAVHAKDLPLLTGSGFEYDEENLEYYSTIEGKVTVSKSQNSLNVTPVFVLEGDLEAATGGLSFRGDVIVKGNVFSNVTLKTTGCITINGHVEVATLIAGKDILLKNGMQGSGLGRIQANGDVMAKFLEQTSVKAKGNIQANAILNCNVEAGKSIIVSGTRGAILGGSASAVEKITAYSLGNRIGIATKIVVGLENDFKATMETLDADIDEAQKNLRGLETSLSKVTYRLQTSSAPALTAERTKLMRDKILCQTTLNDLISKRDSLADIRERSANGKIVVNGPVNAGCMIIINGITEVLTTERKNVTFTRALRELRILSNTIDESKPRR